MTLEIRKSPIAEYDIHITGRVRRHMNAEHYPHLPGQLHVSLDWQSPGNDVVEQGRVRDDAVGHQGEGEVEGARVPRPDPPGRDGDLPYFVAAVAEEGRAVVVLEADAVRVVDGEAQGQAHVHDHAEAGEVHREVEVVQGHGVHPRGGMPGLEHGEAEDQEEEAQGQKGRGHGEADASASPDAAGGFGRVGLHQLSRG